MKRESINYGMVDNNMLRGVLMLPANCKGLIVFAHGAGSSMLSPRNNYVAERLYQEGFGALLISLLSQKEELNRDNVFDIKLLANRLLEAIRWIGERNDLNKLPIFLFGSSTGAAAALVAEVGSPVNIAAIVSRGGRPDLANEILPKVKSPTLLIVGGLDDDVIILNQEAMQLLTCEKELSIIRGATHLFEEPGKLEEVVNHSLIWFNKHI